MFECIAKQTKQKDNHKVSQYQCQITGHENLINNGGGGGGRDNNDNKI